LAHYLFGFEATEADMRTASNNLHSYAELVEKYVRRKEV
jgi:hypothetical protein